MLVFSLNLKVRVTLRVSLTAVRMRISNENGLTVLFGECDARRRGESARLPADLMFESSILVRELTVEICDD